MINISNFNRVPDGKFKQEMIIRGKPEVSELYPPFTLKDEALVKIAQRFTDPNNDEKELKEHLLQTIPKINYNLIAEFCLHLAFDAKYYEPMIWKTIEK